jgi:hypothetical protein
MFFSFNAYAVMSGRGRRVVRNLVNGCGDSFSDATDAAVAGQLDW